MDAGGNLAPMCYTAVRIQRRPIAAIVLTVFDQGHNENTCRCRNPCAVRIDYCSVQESEVVEVTAQMRRKTRNDATCRALAYESSERSNIGKLPNIGHHVAIKSVCRPAVLHSDSGFPECLHSPPWDSQMSQFLNSSLDYVKNCAAWFTVRVASTQGSYSTVHGEPAAFMRFQRGRNIL